MTQPVSETCSSVPCIQRFESIGLSPGKLNPVASGLLCLQRFSGRFCHWATEEYRVMGINLFHFGSPDRVTSFPTRKGSRVIGQIDHAGTAMVLLH